jgi:hypothetical protein
MKNIICFLILLLSISPLKAQVSGYKGKRNTIEIGTEVGLNWLGYLTKKGVLEKNEKLRLPITIQYEHAIKRQRGLLIAMSWTSCKFETELFPTQKYVWDKGSTYDLTVGYVKYYSNWGLAPIGSYVSYNAGPQFIVAQSGEIGGKTFSKTAVNAVFSIAWGTRRLIAGNLSLDYGARVITSLGYSAIFSGFVLLDGNSSYDIDLNSATFEADYKRSMIGNTAYITAFNGGLQFYARLGLVH